MNLYELQTVYAPEPPHDRPGFIESDVIQVHVDKAMLAGDQNRLIQFVQAKPGHMPMVHDRFAEPTIRALAVLLDIASQPWMCNPDFVKAELYPDKKKKAKTVGAAAAGGDEDAEAAEISIKKSWTYEANPYRPGESRRIMNRMGVYCHTIRDASDTSPTGWTFVFFIYDQTLKIDEGIGLHAERNRERLKRKGAVNAFWQWEISTTEWIRSAVSPYVRMRFTTENAGDREQIDDSRAAFEYPLKSPMNPAQAHKVFTFENARHGWDLSTIHESQRAASSYYSNDYFRAFPKGAKWIPPQLLNVRAILNGLLERPAYALGIYVNPLESLMKLTMASDAPVNSDPDHLLRIVSKSYADLIKTEADRKNPECVSRFVSWVGSSNAPPGIQACWELVRTHVDKPVVPEYTVVIDPTLSHFGNAVCWEMQVFEQLFETCHLHSELLFDYINAVGAFRAKRTLRLHVLRPGPPASGKSWELDMLMRLCAHGTWKNVGHQSKRSDTTNTNRDCTLRVMDEAGEAVSDKSDDGSGRAELKQILTSGVTYTETCEVDQEMHTRETRETISYLLVLLLANTNAKLSVFPPAIVSRVFVRYMPERRRKGVIDPALRDTVTSYSETTEAEIKRHQLRHALAGLVSHAIDVGWLPEVDMEYAIMMVDHILTSLREKKGVNPDARSKQRLPLYMRALTIWYATYMVFQTNVHFAPGTPFRPEHLLECARYLRCSREIVYFAITHMYDSLINVNAPVVCAAIKSLVTSDPLGAHPKRGKGDKGDGEFDNNSYILRLPLVGVRDDELMYAGAKAITAAIEKNDMVVYSQEMVMDTLEWMKTQRTKLTNRAAMRTVRAKHDEIGLLFDRELIDGDAVNHVLEAVEESVDDWVRGDAKKRFVTGITFRDGINKKDRLKRTDGTEFVEEKRMFPHLFKVLNAKDMPKTGLPFRTRNPAYREPGFGKMFGGPIAAQEKPYFVLRLDYDKHQEKARLLKLGLPLEVAEMDPKYIRTMEGTYPDTMAETHSKRFEETECTTIGDEAMSDAVVIVMKTTDEDDDA